MSVIIKVEREKNSSIAEICAQLSDRERKALLKGFSEDECRALLYDWQYWARPSQLPPDISQWFCWLVMAGRGFGKTRMGAEWVRSRIEGPTPLTAPKGAPPRVALIAKTSADGREVMLEGESGLMSICAKDFRPTFEATRRRLVWPNGVIGYLFSATEPDQLRGPQHGLAWADELAKWARPEEVWANLLMGLRLGDNPQVMVTTTPRPITLLKKLLVDDSVIVTRGSTLENKVNLSSRFLDQVTRLYGGTRLGRQELDGQLIDDVPGALWSRAMIENCRVVQIPQLDRIIVAVDPPVTAGANADACGIVAVGMSPSKKAYVLADHSCQGLSPAGWAERAVALYDAVGADRIVAEVNNGGDLVENLIRQIAPNVSYASVRATRGKIVRAEPVAALYEQDRVHHTACFTELEDEMCSYTGEKGQPSPDRLDALVWAIASLMLDMGRDPRIRKL